MFCIVLIALATLRDTINGQMYKTTKGAPHVLMDLLPPEDEQTKRKCDADVHSLGTVLQYVPPPHNPSFSSFFFTCITPCT